MESIVKDLPSGTRVKTDKGFSGKPNQEVLKKYKLRNGVSYRTWGNQALTTKQKLFNKLVAAKRFVVERTFGTLKRRFYFYRARYMSLPKVHGQAALKAICCNLLKAINKVVLT